MIKNIRKQGGSKGTKKQAEFEGIKEKREPGKRNWAARCKQRRGMKTKIWSKDGTFMKRKAFDSIPKATTC